jgi:hypothetical protein
MPIVNFHLVMSTLEPHNQHVFIFNVTIINDESMRLTRQIDTCLNTAKIFTHTPKAQEITKATDEQGKKLLMPAMYSRILEYYSNQIVQDLENLFSYHMQGYSTAVDKEQHLKNMFADIFAEKDLLAVEPYVHAIGEEYLKQFY